MDSPATSSGNPAATTDANTSTRIRATRGSETVSALRRSSSDWLAKSRVRGPNPVSPTVMPGAARTLAVSSSTASVDSLSVMVSWTRT